MKELFLISRRFVIAAILIAGVFSYYVAETSEGFAVGNNLASGIGGLFVFGVSCLVITIASGVTTYSTFKDYSKPSGSLVIVSISLGTVFVLSMQNLIEVFARLSKLIEPKQFSEIGIFGLSFLGLMLLFLAQVLISRLAVKLYINPQKPEHQTQE